MDEFLDSKMNGFAKKIYHEVIMHCKIMKIHLQNGIELLYSFSDLAVKIVLFEKM